MNVTCYIVERRIKHSHERSYDQWNYNRQPILVGLCDVVETIGRDVCNVIMWNE